MLTSPVTCSHFTLKNSKQVIFNNTTNMYFLLFALSQQDNAPAHRSHDTVELVHCETPQFISTATWPANNPYLNPVDYHIWGITH